MWQSVYAHGHMYAMAYVGNSNVSKSKIKVVVGSVVRALAAFTKDPNSVSSAYFEQLTMACNSNSNLMPSSGHSPSPSAPTNE